MFAVIDSWIPESIVTIDSQENKLAATDSSPAGVSPIKVLTATSLLLLAVLVGSKQNGGLSLFTVCLLSSMIALLTLVFLTSIGHNGFWSISSVYAAVFFIFHFGIVLLYPIGLMSDDIKSIVYPWFLRDSTVRAIYLSTIGLLSFALGSTAVNLGRGHYRQHTETGNPHNPSTSSLKVLRSSGVILVVVGVAYWFSSIFASGGTSALIGSYQSYRESTAINSSPFIWLIVGSGLSCLAASPPSRIRRIGFMLFVPMATSALLLGVRGSVLYTVLVVVAIAARTGKPPQALSTILLAIVILFTIAGIRELRIAGAGSGAIDLQPGSAFDSIAELGSTLRPVGESVIWHDQGDGELHGASYFAPFDRELCTLSGSICTPAQDDPRVLNEVVKSRVGSIGFSVTAEAYVNFGVLGVVCVASIVGSLMGFFDRLRPSPFRDAFVGAILIEFLYNIRNTFIQLPAHLALTAAIFAVAWVFSLISAQQPMGVQMSSVLPLTPSISELNPSRSSGDPK